MTTTEVLNYLGVSRVTLYDRINKGEIQPLPGNPLLKRQPLKFSREAIEAYKRQAEEAAATK